MLVLAILAVVAGVVGIIGSLFPGIPGPPLSWLGVLLMYFYGRAGKGDPISTKLLLIWLAIVIVVAVVGYIIPSYVLSERLKETNKIKFKINSMIPSPIQI